MRGYLRPAMPFVKSSGSGGRMVRDGGGSKRESAQVRFENGSVGCAEIHWYETTGIGKKEFKIKYFLG